MRFKIPFYPFLFFTFLLSLFAVPAICQDSAASVYPSKPGQANIMIETTEGIRIKGRLISINADEIVFDAGNYNGATAMRAYYIRPVNGNYRIETQYIQSVTIPRGRSIAAHSLGGALGGLTVGIGLGLASLGSNGVEFENFGGWAAATGLITAVGATGGFFYGLFHRRRIAIHADPYNMQKLITYYSSH